MAVTDFILLFAWLLAIGGAVSAALGWFVPRYGFDGHCRNCDYNVSRRPRDAVRCPECGSDISRPRAIVLGRRRIHPAYIKYGTIALLAGGPVVLTVAFFHLTGRSIDNYKPYWMLMAESNSGFIETELSAISELQRRITGKKLTRDQLAEIAAAALKRGGNRPRRLQVAWRGAYLSTAAAGAVQADVMRGYLSESLQPIVEFRTPTRAGDPVPFRIRYALDSMPLDPSISFREVSIRIALKENSANRDLALNILGQPAGNMLLEKLRDMTHMKSIERAQCFADPALLKGIDSGNHPVAGTLKLEVYAGATDVIPIELPWQAHMEVADRSAEVLKPVSAAMLWGEGSSKIRVEKVKNVGAIRDIATVGRSSDMYIQLPKPEIEERVPVSLKLRGLVDEVDLGVVILDGTPTGPSYTRVFVPPSETSRFGDGSDARVVIGPADAIADQFIDSSAKLSSGMSERVEVIDLFARGQLRAARATSQPGTQPVPGLFTAGPSDNP